MHATRPAPPEKNSKHCLIPGGALRQSGQWQAATSTYLFPVKALSRHFRGRMVSLLRQAEQAGELDRVTRPGEVDRLVNYSELKAPSFGSLRDVRLLSFFDAPLVALAAFAAGVLRGLRYAPGRSTFFCAPTNSVPEC